VAGGDADLVARAANANSALQVLDLSRAGGFDLAGLVAMKALATAKTASRDAPFTLDVVVFDREGKLLARA